jgi:hypothetical protein
MEVVFGMAIGGAIALAFYWTAAALVSDLRHRGR